ncbi:C80 family cysteine peptidase [Roseateles chitinivorans]|uniref:C80 family cysteine peptidase n=1 Tax=Roseateles chitinivorans TaxID=2917965 RepID=UPI003D66F152
MKSGHDAGAGGKLAAMLISDLVPVLKELSSRGVIGKVVVHASDARTREHGSWMKEGDRHVTDSPLREVLGYSDPEGTRPWAFDPRNALPGLAQRYAFETKTYAGVWRNTAHAQVKDRDRKTPYIEFTVTRDGRARKLFCRFRDPLNHGASALDMDVAIAQLIGAGTSSRLPPRLGWDGSHIVLLRSGSQRPLVVMSRLFTRTQDGTLIPDWSEIHAYQRFADDVDVSRDVLTRPLTAWRNELTPGKRNSQGWIALKDGKIVAPAQKRRRPGLKIVVLQMDDTPQAFEASLRHVGRTVNRGQVLWLQLDRHGASRVMAGNELIGATTPADKVKMVVVGHGSTGDDQGRRLSGYDGTELARRIAGVLQSQFKNRPPIGQRVTLLSCDLESRFSQTRFVDDFTSAFQRGKDYDVTSFRGQVLFPVDDPESDAITRRWTLNVDDRQAMHRSSSHVFVSKRIPNPDSGNRHNRPTILQTRPKYPSTDLAPRSEATTIVARETALDASVSEADYMAAAVEKDFLFFDPSLEDQPSDALKALFSDAQGRVDQTRLVRVAASPAEQTLLLDDLREHLSVTAPDQVDALSAVGWIDGSMAGRVLTIHGRALPARFLSSLGARIDGMPLTISLMDRMTLDAGADLAGRLTLDADLVEHVLPLLPADDDAASRLRGLTEWLRRDRTSAFHGGASGQAAGIVERLLTPSGPPLAPDARPLSLLDEMARDLSPPTRALLEKHPDLTGAPDAGRAHEVLFDVLEGLPSEIDATLARVSAMTPAQSEADLLRAGVMDVDANGRRSFDLDRLKRHAQGAGAEAIAASGRILTMTQPAFDALQQRASGDAFLKHWLGKARTIRDRAPRLQALLTGKTMNRLSNRFDAVTTILGLQQLTSQMHLMPVEARVLAGVQGASVVVTPASAALGRFLAGWSRNNPVFLRRLGSAMRAGLVDLPLQALTAAILVMEWQRFEESGESAGSYSHKSLVANTVISTVSGLLAMGFTVVQIAASIAGAAAMAGTVLGTASSVAGAAAFPLAALTFLAQGATSVGLWFDAYGRHFRGGIGEKIQSGLALFFGQSTKEMSRAQTESVAAASADRRRESLKALRGQDLDFQSDLHAKQGYATLHVADQRVDVGHATFLMPHGGKDHLFVLQDRVTPGAGRLRSARAELADKGSGMAWLEFGSDGLAPLADARSRTDRQLFRLGAVQAEQVDGGSGDDRFILDASSRIHRLSGGEGLDEVVLEAEGADVALLRMAPGSADQRPILSIRSSHHPGADTRVDGVERWLIRDAGVATLHGGDGNDFFDVSGRAVTLRGEGGSNVFVLHPGVTIYSRSSDTVLWRDEGDATVVMRTGTAPLTLNIDGPHEHLRVWRDGRRLKLDRPGRHGTLTLEDYFPAGAPPSGLPAADVLRPLLVRDATDVVVRMLAPQALTAQASALAALPRIVWLPRAATAWRRAVAGGPVTVLHRVASGSGNFDVHSGGGDRAAPQVMIGVPIQHLRYRREGLSLILEETAAPSGGGVPTSVTLLGWSTSPVQDAPPQIFALEDGRSDADMVAIQLPEYFEEEIGPLQPLVGGAPSTSVESATSTGESTSEAGSTDGDVAVGVEAVAPVGAIEVERGVFVHAGKVDPIAATTSGRHLIRLRTALESSPREIRLPADPAGASARVDGHMLTLVFGDGPERTEVMLRDYYRPNRSPLKLTWTDGEGVVHATTAVVLPDAERARLTPIYDGKAGEAWWVALDRLGLVDATRIAALLTLHRQGSDLRMSHGERLDPQLSRWYLRMHGVDAAVAAGLHLHSPEHTARALRWATVADATWNPAVLGALARQRGISVGSVERHRDLLRHLLHKGRSAPYILEVLKLDLDLAALRSFEAGNMWDGFPTMPWLKDPHVQPVPDGEPDLDVVLPRIREFARLLRREAGATPDLALLEIVLRHRGYAPSQVTPLARVMIAAKTLDDETVAGLMRLGRHSGTLVRLLDAGLRAEDLALGNVHRHTIEQEGDRSGAIVVSAGLGFSTSTPEYVTRYVIDEYLRLDPAGERFERLGTTLPAGQTADLVPGDVLDANGQSTAPARPLAEVVRELQQERSELQKSVKLPESRALEGYVGRGYDKAAGDAGGPAVLEEQGLARRITQSPPPAARSGSGASPTSCWTAWPSPVRPSDGVRISPRMTRTASCRWR